MSKDKNQQIQIIGTIWEYENSVERLEKERLTYTDLAGHIHLKAGDLAFPDYITYAKACAEYLRFGDEVDEATAGAYEARDMLKVCDTPAIFCDIGFAQRPILYTQRHLENALHPKSEENSHWHGLPIPLVKRLPELLARPVMLCDSPVRRDVLLAVLPAVDLDKLPLIAAIKPDGQGRYQLNRIETNLILSVYGRENFPKYFSERITRDKLVYLNKERGQALERFSELQLFGGYSELDLNIIIRRPACLVNAVRPANRDTSTFLAETKEAYQASKELNNGKMNHDNKVNER